jgi:hypothetical protein
MPVRPSLEKTIVLIMTKGRAGFLLAAFQRLPNPQIRKDIAPSRTQATVSAGKTSGLFHHGYLVAQKRIARGVRRIGPADHVFRVLFLG